jgi:pyridinium-3,5-bisthiocarboxylic acid mononucleotide nickel chelatase
MSRVLFIDPVAGLAGDMLCGALLDAGGSLDQLRTDLATLGIKGVRLDARTVNRGAFAAVHFRVRPAGDDADADEGHSHSHSHSHSHAHSHDHDHGPDDATEPAFPGQPERTLTAITALLTAAPLPPRVRARALGVFQRLAEAEGRMHGQPADAVHFHEVGGVDAIHDIVGACLLLEQLDVGRVVCGPIPLGSGRVRSAHGAIPVPAPATVALLRGWPILAGRPGAERTTPTGAALVAAIAEPGPLPSMVLEAQGIGAGTRDPDDHANVCRVLLGRDADAPSPTDIVVLAAQMDDLTGEHLPPLLQALLTAGALDARATPVMMKKGRSGLAIEALARPRDADAVAEAMLRHGSTFGVRRHPARRTVLDRWHVRADTPWGSVRVKVGALRGEVLHAAPEHDDVAAVARAAGQPVPRVHYEAIRALDSAAPPEDPERP